MKAISKTFAGLIFKHQPNINLHKTSTRTSNKDHVGETKILILPEIRILDFNSQDEQTYMYSQKRYGGGSIYLPLMKHEYHSQFSPFNGYARI